MASPGSPKVVRPGGSTPGKGGPYPQPLPLARERGARDVRARWSGADDLRDSRAGQGASGLSQVTLRHAVKVAGA